MYSCTTHVCALTYSSLDLVLLVRIISRWCRGVLVVSILLSTMEYNIQMYHFMNDYIYFTTSSDEDENAIDVINTVGIMPSLLVCGNILNKSPYISSTVYVYQNLKIWWSWRWRNMPRRSQRPSLSQSTWLRGFSFALSRPTKHAQRYWHPWLQRQRRRHLHGENKTLQK